MKQIIVLIVVFIALIIMYQKQIDNFLIYLFQIMRRHFKLESYEDQHHSLKAKSTQIEDFIEMTMNYNNKEDYNNFIKNLHNDHNKILFEKYQKFMIHKKKKKKFKYSIYANHSKISGRELFNIYLSIFKNDLYGYLTTSILKGFVTIPLFLCKLYSLESVEIKRGTECKRMFKKRTIPNEKDKRYIVLLDAMQDVYKMLKLKDNDTMNVMLTASFNEDKDIKNNVGVVIIQYNQNDDIISIKKKIKDQMYQFYASNTLIHIPVKFDGYDIRKHIHCVITSGYIKTDEDFDFYWYAGKTPTEPIYCGIMSQIKEKEVIIHKSYTTNIDC